MSFSRVAPVGFQRVYGRFNWSRLLWPIAQTAADVRGAGGRELCTTMRTEDVNDRHAGTGTGSIRLRPGPRPTQTAPAVGQWTQLYRRRTGRMDRGAGLHEPCARRALPSPDPRQDRALAPDTKEPRAAGELLPTRRPRTPDRGVHRALQPPAHAPLALARLITAE